MKTIACVYRTGGAYSWEWVEKLARAVAVRMIEPYRFVCLSDDLPYHGAGITVLPLRHGWRGWWSKIEVFRIPGPVVYLDLDSLIVGPLEPLFHDPFTMVSDFLHHSRGWKNSSVMAWGGDMSGLYDAFRADPDAAMISTRDGRCGDQAWIEDNTSAETFATGLVVSYKVDARNGPPPGASVVQFHGTPKMADAGGWAKEAWA